MVRKGSATIKNKMRVSQILITHRTKAETPVKLLKKSALQQAAYPYPTTKPKPSPCPLTQP